MSNNNGFGWSQIYTIWVVTKSRFQDPPLLFMCVVSCVGDGVLVLLVIIVPWLWSCSPKSIFHVCKVQQLKFKAKATTSYQIVVG